jgi:hypothetical protein
MARLGRAAAAVVLALLLSVRAVYAQSPIADPPVSRASTAGLFVAGGAAAFAAHEAGHLVFDFLFDADPGIGKVDFHGIPFFAITHRSGLSATREFTISSAGFWVQHGGSEWLLTRRPNLRRERAPFAKGVLAFNVLTSMAYAGAALARTGPFERDTRGMASSSRIDERWIGTMLMVPAAFDSYRYLAPDRKWAVWVSRAAKVGMVLLVLKE